MGFGKSQEGNVNPTQKNILYRMKEKYAAKNQPGISKA